MGLNWGAGLTAFGKGLRGVQAAKEKTAELEYRNMRDQNLRRFQLEDRAHRDVREDEKREYDAAEALRKEGREDEKLGIVPETERGADIIAKGEKDKKTEHDREMEKIYARNLGKGKSAAKGKTREEYIEGRLAEYNKIYMNDVNMTKPGATGLGGKPRTMSKRDRDWLIRVIGDEYDSIYGKGTQVVGSPVEQREESKTPFDEDMPSQEEAVAKAQEYIQAGADRDDVIAYLQEQGYDTSGL